jgi:hypothetical protein
MYQIMHLLHTVIFVTTKNKSHLLVQIFRDSVKKYVFFNFWGGGHLNFGGPKRASAFGGHVFFK